MLLRWSRRSAAFVFLQAAFYGALSSVETQVRWTPGVAHTGPSVRIAGVVSNICWNAECAETMNGYRLFFDFLNKLRGGVYINGTAHAVHFEALDDGHSVHEYEQTREATRILIQDRGFRLFLGPANDASSSILEKEVAAASGVLVTPATAMNVTARAGPGIFSVGLPADRYLHSAMDLLKRVGAAPVSVAFLSTTDPIQRLACIGAQSYARSLGMTVVASEALAFGSPIAEIVAMVRGVQAKKPDVLVGCTSRLAAEACFHLLAILEMLDFEIKALVLTSCVGMDEWQTGAYRSGQYVLGVKPWTHRIRSRSGLLGLTVGEVMSNWTKIYNSAPSHMVASSMAAAEMLVTAIETSNSMDPQAVSAALQAMTTSTLVGDLAFDSEGMAQREAYVIQYQQGSTDFIVAPPSAAERPVRYPKPSFKTSYCYYDAGAGVTVTAYGLLNDTNGTSVCVRCPDGLHAVAEGSFQVCRPCPSGTKAKRLPGRTDLNAFCEDCRPGRHSSQFGVTDCVDCPMGRFVDIAGATACRDCSPGMFARVRGMSKCISCQEWSLQGVSSYVSSSGSADCLKCPDGGLCEPDANGLYTAYTNIQGYFRLVQNETDGNSSRGQPDLHRCVHDDGKACEPRGLCNIDPVTGEPASMGPFCGACRDGYGRERTLDACQWCGSMDQNIGVIFLNLAITSSLVVTTFLSNVSTKTKFRGTRTVIIKQFISYIIMVSVAFEFTTHKYPFGFTMGSFLRDITSLTGMSGGGIVQRAAQCWAASLFPGVEFFKICTIFGSALAPILVAVEFAFFQLISAVLCLMGRPRIPWRQLVSLITITLFVLLPRITGLILMPMDCFTFDRPRLLSDTRVLCDTEEHRTWKTAGYIGFFANSIGIPLIMFILLTFYQRRHELEERHVLNMLGFLYTGFESGKYYFECVNMMRNVLVEFAVGVPFLPATSIEEQEMMACASLNILHGLFLIVHLIAQPYDNRSYFLLDRVETYSLTATWSTTIFQTWLTIAKNSMRKDTSSGNTPFFLVIEEILGAVVFTLHLRFWAILLYAVLRDFRPLCSRKMKNIHHVKMSRRNTSWCKRKYRAFVNPGKIEVTEHGFRLIALSDDSMSLFCQLFAELVDTLSEDGDFTWAELVVAVHHLAITAYCVRIKNRITSARPVHYALIALKEKARAVPCIGSIISELVDRTQQRLSRITHRGKVDVFTDQEIECLGKFTEVNVMNIIGRRFTVEEIHNAALRLGHKIRHHELMADGEVKKSVPNMLARCMNSFSDEKAELTITRSYRSSPGSMESMAGNGVLSMATLDRIMQSDSEKAALAAQQKLASRFSNTNTLRPVDSIHGDIWHKQLSEESSDMDSDGDFGEAITRAVKSVKYESGSQYHRTTTAESFALAADCVEESPEAASSGRSTTHVSTSTATGQSEGANSPHANRESGASSSGAQESVPVMQERGRAGEAVAPSSAPVRSAAADVLADLVPIPQIPQETNGARPAVGVNPRATKSPRVLVSDLSRLMHSTEDVYAFLEETVGEKKFRPTAFGNNIGAASGHAVLPLEEHEQVVDL